MTQPADPGENAPLDFPTRSEGPEPARCPETPPPPAAPGDQNTPVVEGSTAVPLTRADEGGGDLLTLSGGDVPTGEGGGPREPAGEIPAGGPAVPGYEICRELGRGGMGVVYLARQIGLDRLVALKMILAGSHASQEDLVRFRAEAEAAARLQHPNIVQVYEVGQAHGLPYFSLELCTGGSLEKKLARTPWPARKAAQLVELLARAVHCAHQRQVVHRDLKPANVLLTEDGTPKITDFGLAKRLDAVGQTRSGALMGTPSYMAPEQAQGRSREVGSHTDVYALGALLYECLTGRPPFLAETSLDTVLQVIQDEPVPPTRLAPSCPRDLETVCLKCLHKEPPRRYATAEALAEDLRAFQEGRPVLARRTGLLERSWRWCRRNPAVAGLLAAVLLSLTGGTVIATGFAIEARRREDEAVEAAGRAEESKALAQGSARQARQEKRRADQEATAARDLARQAQEQKQEAVRQLRRADANFYINSVGLAGREGPAGNRERVRELLDQCPHHLLHWEWYHLTRLAYDDSPVARLAGRRTVVFSPDGRRIVTGSDGNVAVLRDAQTAAVLAELTRHAAPVRCAAFSPDGRLIATGSEDFRVRLWDAASGEHRADLSGHADTVTAVAFSGDGRRLASAGDDTTVKLWDVAAAKELRTLDSHTGAVTAVVFGPGKVLASASMDGTVRLHDAQSGELLRVLRGHPSAVRALDAASDGTLAAGGGADDGPGYLLLWDSRNGQQLRALRGHAAAVTGVAFSPDGRRLASVGHDGTLRLWDFSSGQEVLMLPVSVGSPARVVFSPEGGRLAVAGEGPKAGVELRLAVPGSLPMSFARPTRNLLFAPDGRHLVSDSGPRTVALWDAESGNEIRVFRGHEGGVDGVALQRDGNRLATASADHTVKIWDVKTGTELLTLRGHEDRATAVAFSPDGLLAVSGDRRGVVRTWDARGGKARGLLQGHGKTVTAIAFHPLGRRFATASLDGTVRLWDAARGKEVGRLTGPRGWVSCVAFSDDGTLAASAGEDGVVQVHDGETGKPLRRLTGHTDWVLGLAFRPGTRQLATAGADRTVRLWEASTGEEVHRWRSHTGWVTRVAFSPDGKRLASAAEDGTVKVHTNFDGPR